MDRELQRKYARLQDILRDMGGVLVAFSGGVDSTLLLRVAHDVLGPRALAVTACSETYPARERAEAREYIRAIGARAAEIETSELALPGFAGNPPDRCYHCKTELFSTLRRMAEAEGLPCVADGSNVDDLEDFRPGARALGELGIRSPLREAGLGKREIRELSRWLGLPTWNRPSAACLSSRFPYGTPITREALAQVEAAEDLLRSMGFRQIRVRHHSGGLARIEVDPEEIHRFADPGLRQEVVASFRGIGYTYVSLDLQGYRTGSMNEVLPAHQREAAAV
ncbi:MAG TPA: ATP-dependent sacrificial sulfur transferase LarE [Armatimonadota bacterium]|nr:ATP-dependent sacrificial sulfur transferase LarE [Armatimonadota bacterium]